MGFGILRSMYIDAVGLFSALSGDIRLRCLLLLQHFGELCVCDLTHALGESQPKISRHLGHLREAGLVQDRRQGLWVHYRLHPQLPDWVRQTLAVTAAGVGDQHPYSTDRTTLEQSAVPPAANSCS